MRYLLILLFSFLFSFIYANEIKLTDIDNQFRITKNELSEFSFVNHLSEINTLKVKAKNGIYTKMSIAGYGENAINGHAELPVIERLINVPLGAEIVVKILNTEEKIIALSDYDITHKILPSQPSLSKSENAEDVPFYYDEDYYNKNVFHVNEIITTELLGKMRGQQLARLSVSPFTYNPVTNELKVITKLEVKIIFKNIDLEGHKLNREKYYSPGFENLYKQGLNYTQSDLSKDVITTYPVKYVIISDPAFQSALQPLVEWKTKKGFLVVEGYTNDPAVGNTTTSIHNFIKDMYDNATANDPAPTYLLIVGDDNHVPSFNGNAGSHISDMYYCEFDGGGDYFPEMYFGRFSASNSTDVDVQVNKTLTHEQYTFTDPSFLDNIVLVAGVDASMAPTYGNGQINYGTDNYFNAAHGLTIQNYLYGVLAPGANFSSDMSGASAAIISDISEGAGFANYTAHCGPSGWSDPSFENSDVPGLQNLNEYGVMIGNCCQSNKFDVNVCFGEALLRADNKGAVGYIGGSNNTYWNEDYWWAVGNGSISANPVYSSADLGSFDCLMHENGEQQADWFITQAQMMHSGNLAVTQAGGSLVDYYWEIYHVMGDPSLMPYIGVPGILIASHAPATPVGSTTLSVTTEEHAYVAISMNGVLLDAQLAGPTGVVNLNFLPISNVGVADIVITKQFKQPYIGGIQIISPTGPYVINSGNDIDDNAGNNNSQIDYDELIDMYLDLHNVGSVDATSVNISVSTTDPYVTITNSSITVPIINASQVISTTSPFSFQVASFVPDQHLVTFDLVITDNLGNTWNSTVTEIINAPVLDHTLVTIDDATANGNGRLDAGETLDVIVDVTNIGHADINNLIANISCLSNYVTVNSTTVNISSLSVNQQQSAVFNITIDGNTPVGTVAEFLFDITDGDYAHNTDFTEIIGIIDEDYETGDYSQYAWVIDPDFPWFIDNTEIYEGANSSRSYDGLPHNEESELSVEIDVTADGDISFWKFVSSEEDYDYLKFKINGSKVGEWSGEDQSWSFVSFAVTAGLNEFKWEYDKDGGWEEGMDCAWIDYIVFPPMYVAPTAVFENKINIELFPNPTKGSFQVQYNDTKKHSILIYDVKGNIILDKNNQYNSTIFDITDYAPGTYTVKVLPESVIYQIVKQ